MNRRFAVALLSSLAIGLVAGLLRRPLFSLQPRKPYTLVVSEKAMDKGQVRIHRKLTLAVNSRGDRYEHTETQTEHLRFEHIHVWRQDGMAFKGSPTLKAGSLYKKLPDVELQNLNSQSLDPRKNCEITISGFKPASHVYKGTEQYQRRTVFRLESPNPGVREVALRSPDLGCEILFQRLEFAKHDGSVESVTVKELVSIAEAEPADALFNWPQDWRDVQPTTWIREQLKMTGPTMTPEQIERLLTRQKRLDDNYNGLKASHGDHQIY